MTDALVSVVVTNHDYERFLASAVDSALGQTWSRTEVLVVDDGSTDASREVISSYGDRIKPILLEHGGQDRAMLAGLEQSKGEAVLFLDSDDALGPEAARSAAAALACEGTVKVHWPLVEIDADGRPTGDLRPNRPLKHGDLRELVLDMGPAPESYATPPTSGKAWARSFLEEVLPPPPGRPLTSGGSGTFDSYLSSLAPLFGRIARVEEPRGCYRVHGANRHAGGPSDEKEEFDLRSFHYRCDALAGECRARGIAVDPSEWVRKSWAVRYPLAQSDIERTIPAGAALILVDEDDIGPEIAEGRRVLPFRERDGRYWGPPNDDVEAVAELERLRREGAEYMVVGWPAFWWLEHYRGLAAHLDTRYRCTLRNDRLVAFDLSA